MPSAARGSTVGEPSLVLRKFWLPPLAAVAEARRFLVPLRLAAADQRLFRRIDPKAFFAQLTPFISLTKDELLTVISTQAGRNPLFIALRTDLIFDHAAQ